MDHTSINDNWLTLAVESCRDIRRLTEKRERRAEVDCVVDSIEQKGNQPLLAHGRDRLRAAVDAGLTEAGLKDSEAKKPGYIGPSPAQICVLRICDELGVDYSSI